MKKVSGVRFMVSGVGCRVSGVGCRVSGALGKGLGILTLILLFSWLSKGFAQELRYKFKAGQVIQYDYLEQSERVDGYGSLRELYEFRVDSCTGTGAYMTMTIKQHSTNSAVYSYRGNKRNEIPEYYQSSIIDGYDNSTSSLEAPLMGDINRPIHFFLTEYGQISRFWGLDALLQDVLEAGRDNGWIKLNIHFNLLKIRYSEEFYAIRIRQFFPPLPVPTDKNRPEQSVPLNHLGRTIRFGFVWQNGQAESGNKTFRFDCPAILHAKDSTTQPNKEITSRMNKPSHGMTTWNSEKAVFETLSFNGINLIQLLYFWLSWDPFPGDNRDSARFGSDQISINLIKSTDHNTFRTRLQIVNADSLSISIFYPTDGIQPVKCDELIIGDPAILDLDIPLEKDGIVEVRIPKPYERRDLWPNNIRIYAQPGDSVTVSASWDNLEQVQFRGSHAIENAFLNQLFRFERMQKNPFDYRSNDSILQSIRNYRTVLESSVSKLDPNFVKRLDFELTYLERQWELNNLFLFTGQQPGPGTRDTLHYYKKFLGQSQYPESAAYRNFILNFVSASQESALVDNGNSDEGRYVSSATFLNGWDRYWALANFTYGRIIYNEPDRDRYYQSFMAEYSATAFGRQLKDLYNFRLEARLKIIKMLELDEFIGQPVMVSMNYENSIKIIKRMVKDSGNPSYRGMVFLQYVPESNYDKILFELRQFTEQSREINPGNEIKFLPRILPDSVEYYLKHLNRDQKDILVFDRDGNWCTSLSTEYYNSGWIDNLISWPRLIPNQQKTISLTTFWYSLAGACVLTLIIILSLRIRAKRREARLSLKRRMAQLEVDAVRSRMNPHFLFNALSSMQNLINRKQIEEANLYLARFGDLVRTILNQSAKPAIGLNEEIDMIRNYLQLEQLRFPFTFDIQVGAGVDIFAIEIPPLLIQPHVENAVMHGISGLGKAGRIAVVFRNEAHHLECEVKDNGPGYHPEARSGNGGLGQGWKLTRQRIDLMKELYGDDVSVEVRSGIPAGDILSEYTGTTVIFRLPIQQTT